MAIGTDINLCLDSCLFLHVERSQISRKGALCCFFCMLKEYLKSLHSFKFSVCMYMLH